jgi:hypothetical protein
MIYYYKGESSGRLKNANKIEMLLCAALGTVSHQHGFEVCSVHCRSGNMLKNDRALLKHLP